MDAQNTVNAGGFADTQAEQMEHGGGMVGSQRQTNIMPPPQKTFSVNHSNIHPHQDNSVSLKLAPFKRSEGTYYR